MYIVNGKIYTDSSLLDEIVYNCKLILNDIVIKNEKLALQYETEQSLHDAEIRLMCRNNTITFLGFPWTYTLLIEYGYTPEEAGEYIDNMNLVPEEDRDDLLEFGKWKYINEIYVETNKYYRSLLGLPEYNTTKYDVYLTPADFPANYDTSIVDFKIPVHEYPLQIIDVLQSSGCMDVIIEKYRSFNYSYLRYLGGRALDIDKARNAGKFDILFMPAANADVQYRFQELYDKNKDIYLVKVYQDAYSFGSDYYDNMMIVMLLAQTFNDMVVDVPEWYIRKDVFDIRTVQYFLESFDVPFFREIPLKYQVKIVKSINNLIQSKSTMDNFDDILKIFNLRQTHIYRYYLYKKHKTDPETGEFIIDDDPEKMYELEFIEVLLGDTYDNYIKDLATRVPYDELTTTDQFWDGTYDHDEVKRALLKKDFIVEPTKYITIKADIVYGDYQKQLSYFLSMVFDTRVAVDDIYISVPSLSESVKFSLNNLLLFIECLCHLFFKTSTKIRRPEDMCEPVTKTLDPFDFEPDDDRDDWWMMKYYPETFTDKTYNHNRIYGFNPELDMEALKEMIERPNTNYTLDNFYYTFYDLYLSNYIELPDRIFDLETLMDIYDNNIKCMEKLQFDITHSIGDKDKLQLANYVYNEVYTKSFDYAFYGDNEYLERVLANKDYFLFNLYNELRNRQVADPESASNDINTILSDVVSVLSFYLNRNSLDYLFALVSDTSFDAILKYIYWMLDAFKSYKLHFINPITKYIADEPNRQLGNNMEMADTIFQHTTMMDKVDAEYMWDEMTYKESTREVKDYFRGQLFEILDIYTKIDQDPNDDYVYDGGTAASTAAEYTKRANGGRARDVYPFKVLNGHKSYMLRYDEWNLDFNRAMPDSHDYNFGELPNDPGNVTDDWNFGELGDAGTIDEDCNFGENPDDPGNMQDEEDWNFGELVDDPDEDFNFGEIPGDPGNMYEDDNFGEVPDDPGNVEAEWDFGDLDDPAPIIIDDDVIEKECDFGELDDPGNVEKDYDFNIPEDDYAVIKIDGGNILDHMFDTTATYYENFFKKIYNCGIVNTDKFINKNFFLRIIDDQHTVQAKVATRTGLRYAEDITGNITLTEYWREWKSINDFEILNDISLMSALYAEGRIDLWTQLHEYHELPYGEDYDYVLNHYARRATLYLLDELMNQNIDIYIDDTYPDGNNITDANWNFGELPDDPGDVVGDKNFGEVPDDSGNMHDDYEFGEISDIYYITKLGNYDSSKVISIPRTI